MKERPILFNAEMVRAIRADRKTQTRRVIKPRPPAWCRAAWMSETRPDTGMFSHAVDANPAPSRRCPYGAPGDRLWVRETICTDYADGIGVVWNHVASPSSGWKKWTETRAPSKVGRMIPSIFMPRWASRISLEVVRVDVERLHEITDHGAEAEGVEASVLAPPYRFRSSFHSLWDSINADRGFGWESNPWVWVVEFKISEDQP